MQAMHELLRVRILHLKFIIQLLDLSRLHGDRIVRLATKRLSQLLLGLMFLVADKNVLVARV